MKRLINFCAVFVFLLLAVSAVFTSCADLYDETELDKNELCIASTGSDTEGDGTGIKPYLTLGKALEHINNAGLGSSAEWTIYVLDEVICSQEISPTTFTGSKLTLQGINGSCALNGNQLGSVLKITAPGTFEINKLKITGGTGTNDGGLKGGGIYLYNTNASVIIANNSTVKLNTAATGAAIYIREGRVKVYGTITENNATSRGGGIYIASGTLSAVKAFLDLYGSITANTANTGGGIYICGYSTATLFDNYTITVNTTAGDGPGVYIDENGTLSGDRSHITNNGDGIKPDVAAP